MSNYSKFKRGDKVVDRATNIKYTVEGVHGKTVKVRTNWDTVIEYKEEDLKFFHADIESFKRIDEKWIGDKCPKCQTPWTRTKFGSVTWYDCLKCKKKAEDLLTYSTTSSASSFSSTDDDLMNQIEMLLTGYDDDIF